MAQNHETGKWGEEEAQGFLLSKGYEVLDVNWKFLHLEIDIVAKIGEKLVIVEVKTRGTDAYGDPEMFVSKTKQRKLIRAANLYLDQKKLENEVRFDVIGIIRNNGHFRLRHVQDAFAPFGG
ncbi:MAG TPA: YraN family protein [Bacteroidia bacterium]|nr:YraN family protein [Bacteroidia bacterium]